MKVALDKEQLPLNYDIYVTLPNGKQTFIKTIESSKASYDIDLEKAGIIIKEATNVSVFFYESIKLPESVEKVITGPVSKSSTIEVVPINSVTD